MDELKHFGFYINFMDIDEYCYWITEEYGEDSSVSKTLDSEYERLIRSHNQCKDILFEIRRFLVKKGFEGEVSAADIVFEENRKNRGEVNPYIPLSKRME